MAAIWAALALGVYESSGVWRVLLIVALLASMATQFLQGYLGLWVYDWMFIGSGLIAAITAIWLTAIGYGVFSR